MAGGEGPGGGAGGEGLWLLTGGGEKREEVESFFFSISIKPKRRASEKRKTEIEIKSFSFCLPPALTLLPLTTHNPQPGSLLTESRAAQKRSRRRARPGPRPGGAKRLPPEVGEPSRTDRRCSLLFHSERQRRWRRRERPRMPESPSGA